MEAWGFDSGAVRRWCGEYLQQGAAPKSQWVAGASLYGPDLHCNSHEMES
jgi:hypothetical protein